MSRTYKNIIYFLFAFLVFQSCSGISQYSIFNATEGKRKTIYYESSIHTRDINKNQNSQSLYYLNSFSIMPFCSNNDSINFWIEPFLGGKMLFFGLAYLPVIPNFLLPFTYPHEAKKVNEYHIMLAFSKYDFIDVEDIGFYRNGEKIVPESIDLIEFDNERFPNEYNIKSTLRNDLPNYKMYPNNYYLFTFKIKTFTTKKIEIRLVNNPLLVINRKKEILHEIIFTH